MAKVSYPRQEYTLPAGRYVRGSPSRLNTTDHKNQPLSEDKYDFWMAIAVEKSAPGITDVVNGIMRYVWDQYQPIAGAQGIHQQISMGLAANAFAWKIEDGDIHPKWSQRDGCRGCYIFILRTGRDYPFNTIDGNLKAMDPKAFQLGDYVDAHITVAINGEVGSTAGIFINPVLVRWLGHGPRIHVGVDPTAVFKPTGTGYTAPPITGGAPTTAPPQQHAAPGQAGPAPGAPPTPPAPPQTPPPALQETPAQWNMRHVGQHHEGYIWNPATSAWDLLTPAPPPPASGYNAPPAATGAPSALGYAPPAMPGGYSPPNGAHAGAPAAQAYAPPGVPAPSAAPGGYPGQTAYPSSPPQYGPGSPPPGVTPYPGTAGGPPRV